MGILWRWLAPSSDGRSPTSLTTTVCCFPTQTFLYVTFNFSHWLPPPKVSCPDAVFTVFLRNPRFLYSSWRFSLDKSVSRLHVNLGSCSGRWGTGGVGVGGGADSWMCRSSNPLESFPSLGTFYGRNSTTVGICRRLIYLPVAICCCVFLFKFAQNVWRIEDVLRINLMLSLKIISWFVWVYEYGVGGVIIINNILLCLFRILPHVLILLSIIMLSWKSWFLRNEQTRWKGCFTDLNVIDWCRWRMQGQSNRNTFTSAGEQAPQVYDSHLPYAGGRVSRGLEDFSWTRCWRSQEGQGNFRGEVNLMTFNWGSIEIGDLVKSLWLKILKRILTTSMHTSTTCNSRMDQCINARPPTVNSYCS